MAAGLSTSPAALQDLLLLRRVQEPTWCLWPNGGQGLHPPSCCLPAPTASPYPCSASPSPDPSPGAVGPAEASGPLLPTPAAAVLPLVTAGLSCPPRAPRVVLPGTVAEGLCCTGSNACSTALPKPFCPCSHPIKLMEVGSVGGCSTHSAPSPGSPLPDPGMGHRGCPEPPTRRLPPHPGAAARGHPAGANPGQLGRCHHAAAACVPVTPSSSPRTLRRCRRPP